MKENIRLPLIAGLIVGIPILAVVIFSVFFLSSGMATADSGDHLKLIQLEKEIQQQNATIQNLVNFLINQQIPFDQQMFNYTRTHP